MWSARFKNEEELYDGLLKHLLSVDNLYEYEYPILDPSGDMKCKKMRQLPYFGMVAGDLANKRSMICARCKSTYQLNSDTGIPVMNGIVCKYHPRGIWDSKYQCCGRSDSYGEKCCSNSYHVQNGEQVTTNFKGFVETQPKPERDPNKHGIYPLKCERIYTTIGLELARIIVLNHNLEVVYEKLVKPKNPILDYNTNTSGLKEGDLDNVTTTLDDVHRDLLELFSSKSILIGHGLDHDMLGLKMIHKRYIDTARLYTHHKGRRYRWNLAELRKREFGENIQVGAAYDSNDYAKAAFKLVMKKINTSYY